MTGYILIDLTGIDVAAESAATVAGSYSKVVEALATKKPIIIEGIVNDDIALSAFGAVVYLDSSGAEIEFNTTKITISSADSVTIGTLIPDPDPEAKTTTKKSTK